jgi:hypothetical protein
MRNRKVKIIITLAITFFAANVKSQNTYPVGGPIGISNTFFTPVEFLDVNGGSVNLRTTTESYKIAQQPVLWYNNDASSIYVGVGAGNGIATTAFENTFVGNNAGTAITTGDGNTFVGQSAGQTNTTGEHNVFIGETCANDNTGGFQNVAVGHLAGDGNTTGDNNTFIGEKAIPIGSNLNNATAIGAFSTVAQDNTLVLGSIDGINGAGASVDVGIGTNTPVSVLHLNRNANATVVTQYTNTGALTINGTGFQVGIAGGGKGIIQHQAVQKFIEVSTFGHSPLASFTTDNFFGVAAPLDTRGDGVRIHDPNNLGGDLDLWTSTANQTHIVWGPNGRIQGINDRFEIQADFDDGLWFNVVEPNTGIFFNLEGDEYGRLGKNKFWRLGPNTTGADAANTLDVNGTAGIRTVTSNAGLTKLLAWNDASDGLIQYRDISSLA